MAQRRSQRTKGFQHDTKLLEKKLPQALQEVREFLKKEFQLLLATSDFIDSIPGAVFNRASANEATVLVVARINSLIKILL